MTDDEAKAVVTAYFTQYERLAASKGLTTEAAAGRIGISRARFYQLKKGDTMLKLPAFLTLMNAVNEMQSGEKS